MRVAFLTNIVSPYRARVFERLARTPGWDFRVITNASTEFDRQWKVDYSGFQSIQSRSLAIRRRVRSSVPVPFDQVITWHVPTGLWGTLRRFRPDMILSHEIGPRTGVASVYARMHGVPLVVWSYQSRVSATQGSWMRRPIRRWLLQQASAVIGMGRQAREVLTAWGADPRLIVDAPNAADAEGIERTLRDPRSAARAAALRSRFGNGRRIAIVPGRLVPLKGTTSMLDVWGQLPRHVRERWRLIFLGDGPLDEIVRGAVGPDVALAGKVEFEEMIDWYRAADLTIFPSLGDVWGLVVNESMACGTPTLCSVHAGCADDLISNGENGFTFDPATPAAAVVDTVRALTHHRLDALGERARLDVSALTPERLAEGFRRAAGLGREEFAKRKGRLRRLPST